MTHAYAVGQPVKLESNALTKTPAGDYVVTRLVPDEGKGLKYRIKSTREQYERVAMEYEITPLNF